MQVKIKIDRDSMPFGAIARALVNRRRSRRRKLQMRGELEWINGPERIRMAAWVTNVSDRGAQVRVEHPMVQGYRAVLWIDGQPAEAEVRHCGRQGKHYVLGLLFGEDEAPVKSGDLYWRGSGLSAVAS